MALFTVLATLQLSRQERELLARGVAAVERQAAAEERQAVAFEALIAKLNEPGDDPAVLAALSERLAAANAKLSAEIDTQPTSAIGRKEETP